MTAIVLEGCDKAQDSVYHVSRGGCGNGRGDRGGYGIPDNGEVAAGVSPGSGVRWQGGDYPPKKHTHLLIIRSSAHLLQVLWIGWMETKC
nr:hypothetical protein POGJBKNB_00001 [Methanosarcinales archaeon ANME-2c ERB4]